MKCPTCNSSMVFDYISYVHSDIILRVKGYECTNIKCKEVLFTQETAEQVKQKIKSFMEV